MIKKFNLLFLTFFMIGKIKYAPGTFASLAACLLFIILASFTNITIIFLITFLIFIYSIVAINNSFHEFDSHDPQEIVIDEVVGQMLALLAIPIYETLYLFLLCTIVFLLLFCLDFLTYGNLFQLTM